jgi:hypothetical protein
VLALLVAVPVIVTVASGSPVRDAASGAAEGAVDLVRPAVPAPSPERPAPAPRTGQARAAVLAAEAAAGSRTELAVAVHDRVTRESAVGDRGTEPFLTASLAKVVVAVDMLDRRRLDGLVLTGDDVGLLRRALGPSDDSAMNALWVAFDGPGAAGRVQHRLGLAATSAPRDPSQWGEMSVPAVDFVRIWRYVLDELPSADRDLIVSAMAAAPAIARDGFNQAFGLLSPAVRGPGGPGAVAKQGWLCCLSETRYLHSAGVVEDRYLVVLLTRAPRGSGWDAPRQDLDLVANAVVRALA